jgi:XTP/dITP diphosphohydrolase
MNRHTEVRFVSNNRFKVAEADAILKALDITVIHSILKIEELQTTDTKRLVEDKLLKAYKQIGRPLFVEHTGLYLDIIGGLPGGLTQIIWDTLKENRFTELFGAPSGRSAAIAKTTIAYCDGRNIYTFEGEIKGVIVEKPRGNCAFQWDCVFQPDGHGQTFAEMGEETKNAISMRRIALDKLASHLVIGRIR